MSVTVEIRGTGDAQLRAIVDEGYAQLRAELCGADRSLPGFVDREFRAYLGCGDVRLGFAWLECAACAHHRLVLFSCKTRGFCPSCGGRRMAERAAHWVDRVIPHVATRQFVLTVPWRRRWLLARRPKLAEGVLRVALGCIARHYRKATGRREGRSGAVTAIQRFGSSLNLNLHFHIVHLDGLFDRGADGRLRFFPAPPSTEDIESLALEIGEACERWLAKQGFAGEAEDAELDDEDDVQARMQQLSLWGRVGLGDRAGKGVRRVQRLGGREVPLPPRCASYEGYNLHANVAFRAADRRGLERLCRYVLRPPLAVGRIERRADGTVRIGFKKAWSDGTSGIELSPLELAEKLAAIVPPPRAHTIVYAGVLAGNAAWRAEVVPQVPTSEEADREARRARKLTRPKVAGKDEKRDDAPGWADLLKRVFGVDGWRCDGCGQPMKLRAIVIREPATTRVVRGVLGARGPPADRFAGEVRGA